MASSDTQAKGLLTAVSRFNSVAENSHLRTSLSLSLFAAEKLENLPTHFPCNASAEEARSEFTTLKLLMVSSDSYASLSLEQFAQAVT